MARVVCGVRAEIENVAQKGYCTIGRPAFSKYKGPKVGDHAIAANVGSGIHCLRSFSFFLLQNIMRCKRPNIQA